MQKVAAYLLERREGMESAKARGAEAARLRVEVEKWLQSKGASSGTAGSYKPEDGGTGAFHTVEASDGDDAWWMLQLREDSNQGKRFLAAVSITSVRNRVSVYVTLETGWTTTHIVPVSVDPKCPKVVRSLLSLPGRWYHGEAPLRQPRLIQGFEAGEGLVADIQAADRTAPIVVVSTLNGMQALPDLSDKLGHDLAGLANVVIPDEDAAWALTDGLGYDFTCYNGAVRLFWPHFSSQQDRFWHPLWTAERLKAAPGGDIDKRERLRREFRGLIFRAAALSVIRPREIDQIRDAAGRRAITEFRTRASSLEEYEKLADSYSVDNEQLRNERSELQARVDELELELAKLEAERDALRTHLRSAKVPVADQDDFAPASEFNARDLGPPASGETRFYKKRYCRPNHDVMVRVSDCGCERWEGSHAADKARKGIAKLEGGRNDWKSMQHCALCTGGGVWRVRW